jgi:hypothetical protein
MDCVFTSDSWSTTYRAKLYHMAERDKQINSGDKFIKYLKKNEGSFLVEYGEDFILHDSNGDVVSEINVNRSGYLAHAVEMVGSVQDEEGEPIMFYIIDKHL